MIRPVSIARRVLSAAAACAAFAPATAAAQGRVTYEGPVPMPGFMPWAAAGFFVFFIVIAALAVGFLVFWLFMLIDCAKREWPEKNTWLILLVVSLFFGFHWLTALLYYFLVKRKLEGQTGAAPFPVQPPSPPPAAPPAP